MSMRSVGLSDAARQAARFTAVVVLPTPPFWFTTAITYGLDAMKTSVQGTLGFGRVALPPVMGALREEETNSRSVRYHRQP
jgi:hypothetical protein